MHCCYVSRNKSSAVLYENGNESVHARTVGQIVGNDNNNIIANNRLIGKVMKQSAHTPGPRYDLGRHRDPGPR
jgi:hypothetical protein